MTEERILLAARAGFPKSCSHNRKTRHRAFRKSLVTSRSRWRLRSSFGSQYARLLPGLRPCFGQPCQKHPSTKMARRSRRKTKSGLPGRPWFRRQPLIPLERRIKANRSSVSLFPRERIADMTADRLVFVKTSGIWMADCALSESLAARTSSSETGRLR